METNPINSQDDNHGVPTLYNEILNEILKQVELLEQEQRDNKQSVFSTSFMLEHQIGEDLVDEEDRQAKIQHLIEQKEGMGEMDAFTQMQQIYESQIG